MADPTPKNEPLRQLLQSSAKFKALPKEKQQEHVEKINHLTPENLEKVRQFLEQQNAEENGNRLADTEKLKILTRLYDEVVNLEQKFTGLLKKDPELKDREKDEDKLATLLRQLETA